MSNDLAGIENVLNAISENPFDISLHAQHVALAKSLDGMDAEVQAALEMFTTFYAAGEDVWLQLIEFKKASETLTTQEGVDKVLALYEQAEDDYLSISLLKSHAQFVVDAFNKYTAGEEEKPTELGDLFSPEWTHTALSQLATKSAIHLPKSHEIWDIYREWELEQLENASAEAKPALVEQITALLLERLKQPHSNSDETFQAYSSFTTNYKPPQEYEQLLIDASKIRSQAVKSFSRRDRMENSLTQAGFSLDAYASYISWEVHSKFPDLFVMSGLHERAIAEAAKRRWNGEANAEAYLRSFWTSYCDVVRTSTRGTGMELDVLKRAVRSVPSSGEVWARYIRLFEVAAYDGMDEAAASIAELYETGMSSGVAKADAEQIIPLVLARAGFEKRRFNAGNGDEDVFATLIVIVESGIDIVRKLPTGDQWFRLEKYLAEVYRSAGLADNVVGVWHAAVKHNKQSYAASNMYTDALIKADRIDEARQVFKNGHRRQFDWPEAIWDAWLTFEHLYGSVDDINSALDQIEVARSQLNVRRMKEAAKASYQHAQIAAEQTAATIPVSEVPVPSTEAMDVDQPSVSKSSKKRRADETPEADNDSKRQKMSKDEPASLKRDRENSTVFVSELPPNVTEDELRALFKDCGSIRDVKITTIGNGLVTTVEFMDRESVPAALTKDKKRIHDQEVDVHMAWQSTLYVTNFPENADDTFIRSLFTKYGTLFDVRWPSKKFKNTRRFCYVQFISPTSAQNALELHGRELEAGLNLSVLISNPERKKGRTDHDADEREIHVSGLPRATKSDDLRKIFQEYGTVKDIRLATEKDGRCKGFAFVEFETTESAQAAVQANNMEFKTRRLAVTISDPRAKRTRNVPDTGFGQKVDTRNRSVRVKNLPPNAKAQEGLLQQVLQKIADVKRVEIIEETCEAIVEMTNAAEAGKLLLRTEPLLFGDNTLQVEEEKALVTGATAASRFVPRTAGSKPRAQKKRVALPSGTATATTNTQGSVPVSGRGQNDFRSMLG